MVGGPRLVESDEGFIQILTPNGRLLDGTTKDRVPALRPDEARRAAREPLILEREVAGVDGPARILARPARSQGRTLVVVTGASLGDRDDSLSTLAKSFLIGGPIAVLLASGIGYMLATIGFRPVEAMRQRAKRISLTRDDERLPLPDAHDEIRRLGETLNEMLARLAGVLRARAAVRRRREPRAAHAARGREGRAGGGDARAGQRRAACASRCVAALEETDHLVAARGGSAADRALGGR